MGIPLHEIIGLTAGLLGLAVSVPQLLKVRASGRSDGVSVVTWVVSLISYSAWFGYGLRTDSISQLFTNFVAAVLTLTLVRELLRERTLQWVTASIGMVLVPAGLQLVPMRLLELLLTSFLLSRIPQLLASWGNWRHARISQVSIGTWVLASLGGPLWFTYALLDGRTLVMFTSSFMFLTGAMIIALELSARRRAQGERAEG